MKILNFAALFVLLISFGAFAQEKKQIPPEATEYWEPEVPVVTPGKGTKPPSDAVVLFNGTRLNEWTDNKGGDAKWELKDSAITVVPKTGDIQTKRKFGDCQLHIEFRTPAEVKGESQGRGNSGIFLMNRYELQVLDCYENKTYANGQTGSFYKQHPPLVNVCRKPGEWQTYDVIFMAPRFNEKGQCIIPARAIVLQNGVLIQNNVELWGPTEYIGITKYQKHDAKEPIRLQDHGNTVSYRNIWIREL